MGIENRGRKGTIKGGEFEGHREIVLRIIKHGGQNLDSICMQMHPVPRYVIRGRISELKKMGLIEKIEEFYVQANFWL